MEYTLDCDKGRGRDREKERIVEATGEKHHDEASLVCEESRTGAKPG